MSTRAQLQATLVLLLVAACCIGIAPVRDWLERDMARHMLLEFPLLLACGAMSAALLPPGAQRLLASVDRLGFTGLTLFVCATAYWMIPSALDAALSHASVGASKYASLFLAGFALRLSMQRAPVVLQSFFAGNWVWMTATVGLLYQDTPRQLCLYYLAESQANAGRGLVIAAVAAGAAWCAFAARRWHAEAAAPAQSHRRA